MRPYLRINTFMILLCFIIGCKESPPSQEYTLQGSVTEYSTPTPIPNASIQLKELGSSEVLAQTSSSSNGSFEIALKEIDMNSIFQIEVYKEGYITHSVALDGKNIKSFRLTDKHTVDVVMIPPASVQLSFEKGANLQFDQLSCKTSREEKYIAHADLNSSSYTLAANANKADTLHCVLIQFIGGSSYEVVKADTFPFVLTPNETLLLTVQY